MTEKPQFFCPAKISALLRAIFGKSDQDGPKENGPKSEEALVKVIESFEIKQPCFDVDQGQKGQEKASERLRAKSLKDDLIMVKGKRFIIDA